MKKQKIFDFFSAVVIAICGFIAYSNTFFVPFQFDDIPCIVGNSVIKHFEKISALFYYWPTRFISYLTFAINYKIHGLNVAGYHIVNLMVHICCGLFVWNITKKLINQDNSFDNSQINLIATFSGLIFVLHPVQTQAVTYIYQRHTCLATLFIFSSFLCWIKAVNYEKYRFVWYGLSFLFSLLAMFTKEIAVVIPFIMLMYSLLFKDRIKINIKNWQVFSYCCFLFILFFLIILLTHSINFSEFKQVQSMKGGPEDIITQKEYFLTQGHTYLIYFRLLFLPLNQNVDYDITVSESFFSPPETFYGFMLMVFLIVLSLSLFKRKRIISFAVGFFIISILPQSSIIPKPDLVVEHRLYLPMFGYAIIVPYVFYKICTKKYPITIFLCIIMAFYGFLTYQRNNLWKEPLKLWNDAVLKSPYKARPYLNRGLEYAKKGDIENALKDYSMAIKLNPWYVEAYNNRGILFSSMKKFQEALNDFNMAIKLKPDYAIAYNNRAVMYSSLGKWKLAFNDFNTALKFKPDYIDALKNRGIGFLIQKNINDAIKDFSLAIKIDKKNGELYNYRAIAYLMSGENELAKIDAKQSLKLGYSINPALKTILETN